MFSNLALIYECKAVFCAVTTKKGILKRGEVGIRVYQLM